MATGVNNTLMGLVHQMAELTVSEEQEKMPLEKYFPHPFKIHDYNPTENKIIRTSFLDDDIKDWLRKPSNNNFVFQCLLCSQEMNFKTVFLRGSYFLNRSHLLTKKHTKNVKDVSCVGVLFVSSRKFVMCLESMLENGQIFNAMKNIKRRDELLINNLIKNKIFCYNYSMFTFDIASKSLCEMEMKCDIVQFMIHYIRPLFNFHCLLCDIKSSSFTQVVNHLQGRKHIKKLKGSKGIIISIRDFNIFVSCNLDELSSFLFLDHLNSYLEEIVIASAGTILISGCHSKEGKPVPKYGEIKINVKPIELPNGVKLEKSVKVTTRFNNFLTDLSDDEISNNKLSTAESRISRQKNVTIYEYSSQDFEDHCMDNIIHALITIGCRIWCSRCKKGIYTLQALQAHLSSLEHTKNMRNNEQVGFMCHVCKIFYIELKGECLVHTHSSHQNKIIIKKLSEGAMKSLEYITPLNNSIIKAYGSFLDNIAEAYKFCCLACNDYIKQKLMYLGYHEINDCHKKLPGALFYTLCEYCNVIYIDSQPDWKFGQFKLHFAKHLDDSKGPITYRFYSMVDNYTTCFQTSISSNFFSFKDISLLEKTEPFNGEKLTVSFSKNFTQFDNPGVCSTEFEKCEKWNNDTFFKYIQLYTTLTGKQIKFFECSICNLKKATKTEIFNHLFVSQHQYNQLYMKESFLKICDICDLAILSGNILNLQQHFTDSSHIKELSTVMGLPNTDALTFAKANLTSFMNISRSSLNELIEETTREMKDTYINHHIVFEWLTKDILSLMSHKFPNLSVTFYGSRLSGLATSKSDFDILLNLENKGNDFLDHVKDLLDTENNYFKLKEYISPVIRTEHKNTGYVCEFNLNNPVEHVYNSKIIKIFTDLDDRVLSLLAAVKQWSTATKIRGSSMFSSHAINWLVLFYLMQPDLRIIPNVSFVMSQYDLKSDGVEGCILQWETKINKDKTWLELLEGFFNYYSFMKFSEYKLFPFSGIAVPRIQGVNEDDCPMYMQDPFNKDRNILFNATKDKSDKLTAQCYHSLHLPWRLNA